MLVQINWIPTSIPPVKVGTYLVTTANGKIILDRWDGEWWGRCSTRLGTNRGFGRYKMHRAWTELPTPAEER